MPVDFQGMNVEDDRSERNISHHTREGSGRSGVVPPACALQQAADILNAGRKTAILAGQGGAKRHSGTGGDRRPLGCSHRQGAARESLRAR